MTSSSSSPASSPDSTRTSVKSLEILPPLPNDDDWTCNPDDITLPPELEFEPVRLRGGTRAATPMRQRVFIRVLAETGRVTLAARAAGKLEGSFYHLKTHPQGASFAAAWARALDFGTGRVLDTLLDHAVNGTPEYIYKDGELVAERRRFNHGLMMWLVAHQMPEKFGVVGGLMHAGLGGPGGGAASATRLKTLKAQWQAEWEADYVAKHTSTEADTNAAILKKLKVLGIRAQFEEASRYVDDPAKRAAWEVLHGPQDWARIAAYRKEREVRLEEDAARNADGHDDDG